MSWLTDEQAKLASIATASGAAGVFIATARYTIQHRPGGWVGWLVGGVASSLVAVLVGLALDGSSLSPGQRWALIGVCAYLAEDILIGTLALAALMRGDPLGVLARLLAALRGK